VIILSKSPDIRVLSTHATFEVLSELGPQFERASARRLSLSYDPTNLIKRQIEIGAAFDIAIVTRQALDDLTKQNKILSSSRTDIGRCGLGMAVRKGAPKPDISTIDGFKRALLSTKSIVRSTAGISGVYFETLLDRLGIADAMHDKIKLGPSGRIAELVANGEAEMAVQQISEILPVQGAQFVGPFPAELQLYTVFSAGVGSACQEQDAAKAFIDFMTAPAAVPLFKAKGLEPILQ
jgi:molybdate transport system substrate-binding protein